MSGKLSTSSVTTKGDLLVASAAGVVNRLGVGTTGQQLVPDSTQPLGMKWSAGTYVQATDYGVVFDGSTDDAFGFQSAIAAAISANKPLFLPPGIAIVGTSLSISAPISIIGSGRGGNSPEGKEWPEWVCGKLYWWQPRGRGLLFDLVILLSTVIMPTKLPAEAFWQMAVQCSSERPAHERLL